jgi:BspA type Leucine rich repeat region (6 copies)
MAKTINNLKLLPKNIKKTPYNSFQNLTCLVNVDLSGFPELTTIGYENFKNLYSMQELRLPPSINEIMSSSFINCTSLMRLDLSDYDQLAVIGFDCFAGLWSLTELNLGSYIKEIRSGSFCECTSLVKLDLCKNLEEISYDFFKDCWSLREITFPQDSKIKAIRSGAFYNCTSLTRLDLSNCVELTEISFDTFVNAWSLEELILGPNVIQIKSGAFRNLTSLTSLRIPASVTRILWDTFYGCTQLSEVVFEGDTKVDAKAFQNCPRLAKQKRYQGFIYGKYSELKGILQFEQGKGGTCGITLEGFEDDLDIVILPCWHPFREEALHKWLKIKSICPTCKKKID